MANSNDEQFVLIAETEWKFDYGNYQGSVNSRITKQTLKMGTIEWKIAFNDHWKSLKFSCQEVVEGTVNEVHMELVGYERIEDRRENYETMFKKRHIFTSSANLLSCTLNKRDNLFTIRILKSRSMFPDFTLEGTVVGRIRNNGKLRVGDQVFHVNKQFLAMHSEYFDLLYNDNFKEAKQDVVELKHERADAAMFHDFLLVMHVAEALPNPKNVAALLDIANIYRTDNVRDKCLRHLSMCREMPAEERFMLAGELGFKELQTSLMKNASFEEAKRMLAVAANKAFALK